MFKSKGWKVISAHEDPVYEQNPQHAGESLIFARKNIQLAKQVEFYTMTEGKCVKLLHVGPFSTEPESLRQIWTYTEANKLAKTDRTTKYTCRTLEKQNQIN